MLIENNTLLKIDLDDVIDGVFTAPDDVLYISSNFICSNVVEIILPNVVEIGNNFLASNKTLKRLIAPNLRRIGSCFLYCNNRLIYLEIPNIEYIDIQFLFFNTKMRNFNMPNIKEIGSCFLFNNCNFKYDPRIIKALKGGIFIGGKLMNKKECIRGYNINKILC